MGSIEVAKTDEFFIAIAKDGVHSFIFAGVQQKGKIHLLARVGKVIDTKKEGFFCGLLKAGFSHSKAILMDEGVDRTEDWSHSISYEAYAISYEQYLHFVSLLEKIQSKRNHINCFKPVQETETHVILEYTWKISDEATDYCEAEAQRLEKESKESTDKSSSSVLNEDLIAKTNILDLSHTCRHTAIDLIDYVCGDHERTHHISNKFFRDLPLQTTLLPNDGFSAEVDGVKYYYVHPDSSIPFYILPPPPSSFKDLEPFKRKVLTDLYQRMESMLLIDPNSKETKEKFELLKTLYNESIEQKSNCIEQFVDTLSSWKVTHKEEISTLREKFLFDYICFFKRRSATEKMFDEWFTKDFANVKLS